MNVALRSSGGGGRRLRRGSSQATGSTGSKVPLSHEDKTVHWMPTIPRTHTQDTDIHMCIAYMMVHSQTVKVLQNLW